MSVSKRATLTLRLPRALLAELQEASRQAGCSINAEVIRRVEAAETTAIRHEILRRLDAIDSSIAALAMPGPAPAAVAALAQMLGSAEQTAKYMAGVPRRTRKTMT